MTESYILAPGQHFRMPTTIHQMYDDNNLKPVQRELYLRLLFKLEKYNNTNNFCQNYYPVTIEKIKSWFGQSAKTIRQHIHALSEQGYLQEEGIAKLNKDRPILIGIRFLTDKFKLTNTSKTKQSPVIQEENTSPQEYFQYTRNKNKPNKNTHSEQSLTKAQILKQKMDQITEQKQNTSGEQKCSPLVNKNEHPWSTKKGHNNQIKDQIDLISDPEKIDLIKDLQKREDNKKITLPQFNKILQKLSEKGILLAKDILFKVLCQMQFDMNSEKWRTPDYTHRLNSILINIGNDIRNYKIWVA